MEQSQNTLGKRIAEHRKLQKLTQDQLAEQLGITAQAVSKWENDQSCPDITILPKLAEIFGISVDVLLGAEEIPVREAEVTEDSQPAQSKPSSSTRWEFHYNSGSKGAIGFALWVLLVGGLLLASRILEWDIGLWGIAWPTAMIMYGLFAGRGFSFLRFGFVVFGTYFLLQNLNVPYLNLGNELIWPAVIILFGLALLADALRKPKKPKVTIVNHDNENGIAREYTDEIDDDDTKWECTDEANGFDCHLSRGEHTYCIHAPCLQWGNAAVSVGKLTIDLCNCVNIDKNCEINANCSVGELIFIVPKRYLVTPDTHTVLSSLDISGEPDENPAGIINLAANVSLGVIRIRYV